MRPASVGVAAIRVYLLKLTGRPWLIDRDSDGQTDGLEGVKANPRDHSGGNRLPGQHEPSGACHLAGMEPTEWLNSLDHPTRIPDGIVLGTPADRSLRHVRTGRRCTQKRVIVVDANGSVMSPRELVSLTRPSYNGLAGESGGSVRP